MWNSLPHSSIYSEHHSTTSINSTTARHYIMQPILNSCVVRSYRLRCTFQLGKNSRVLLIVWLDENGQAHQWSEAPLALSCGSPPGEQSADRHLTIKVQVDFGRDGLSHPHTLCLILRIIERMTLGHHEVARRATWQKRCIIP